MDDLHKFWSGLTEAQKREFATRSGFATSYINTHLIHKRKKPSVDRIRDLAIASNGKLSFYGLCDFFLTEEV